jgi:hypothetical protein
VRGHSTARPSCRPFDFDDLLGVFDIVISTAALLDNSWGEVTGIAAFSVPMPCCRSSAKR